MPGLKTQLGFCELVWTDVDLPEKETEVARRAGQMIKQNGNSFDLDI